jgi:hypothetical protein
MMITIAPFTVDLSCDCKSPPLRCEKEEHIKRGKPVTYWAIYLNNKHISYVSSMELAEKTKIWVEKWLKDRI